METDIRKGINSFYGDPIFKTGLSRSGHFTIKEAQLLKDYGWTLQSLSNGTLFADNNEERTFIEQINSDEPPTLYLASLWKKYLAAIQRSKVGYGFSVCNRAPATFEPAPDYRSSDDLEFMD
ncbi:DUF413 domain-containing protein [Thalassotalea ponticola]|uniref:DUF413 domain-containing protein n=1 Tax=Thalassotalea ponticola TaxID=1523392 RepID=UPI0025B2D125|nr:DUF413 domain-containing protein [Thalassotalea ponticola]MDN3652361.1 DUF413 domain-containing protein [Thalassotalea ponticola]